MYLIITADDQWRK